MAEGETQQPPATPDYRGKAWGIYEITVQGERDLAGKIVDAAGIGFASLGKVLDTVGSKSIPFKDGVRDYMIKWMGEPEQPKPPAQPPQQPPQA